MIESVLLGGIGVGFLAAEAWNQGESRSKRSRAGICRIDSVRRARNDQLIISGAFPGSNNQVTYEGSYTAKPSGSGKFQGGPIPQAHAESYGAVFTPTRITIRDPFSDYDLQRIHAGLVFDDGSVRISVTSPECSAVYVYYPEHPKMT